METYLQLFEEVIEEQAAHMGPEVAYAQARKAGLGVSREGRIVSCTGNPQLVLLRLIKCYTEGGSMPALMACMPLINHMSEVMGDLKPANTPDGSTEKPEKKDIPA